MSNETAMTFGYARVSTTGQDEALQLDALEKAGCDRVFADHASGAASSRPALEELLGMARRGDTLVIWRLDRLGRSLRHLLEVVGDLEQRGIALRSLTESIDTSSPAGRLVFHTFGALAEFERDLIRERTRAGLMAARARGRVGGRPTVWTQDKREQALRMLEDGKTVSTVAEVLGVSRASTYRLMTARSCEVAQASGLSP